MSVFVVDASVVVKCFVPEIHSDAARRLLALPHEYVAPDLLSSPRPPTRSGRRFAARSWLTAEEGQQLVADIGRVAVETVSCRALAEDAHALAYATGRTVYDSMYVALAVRLNTRAITADDRLESALRNVPQWHATSSSFRRSRPTYERARIQSGPNERTRPGLMPLRGGVEGPAGPGRPPRPPTRNPPGRTTPPRGAGRRHPSAPPCRDRAEV